MKKVGREIPFRLTELNKARNGEGAFIRLKNGDILFGIAVYETEVWHDDAAAIICTFVSRDEGETWEDKRVVVRNPDGVNCMSLSFLRMANGDIGMFYIQKCLDGTDKLALIRSSDEGKTFSNPTYITDCLEKQSYYTLNNDRVIRLQSGRILVPTSLFDIDQNGSYLPGNLRFFYSDDDGLSWKYTELIKYPFNKDGYQEPGIYELQDGKVWCYIRTPLGYQYEMFSQDGGETWSQPQPNFFFTSPLSPMLIKDVGEYTVAIFNPIPSYTTRSEKEPWGRTPYVMAVSYDKGKTFSKENIFYIEDDLTHGYCYPAVIEGDDYFLIAYYYSDEEGVCLKNQKIVKVMFDEIK